MKRLIVNADDFGLTHGVNRAIAECHKRGIVSSTTLMATSAQFDEAIALAATMRRLSVGCHVVLVDGEPILPPSEVRSLLAPGTNRFYHSIGEILAAVARGRFRAEEVKAETAAQFARLAKSKLAISHFDSHKHTHMFPSILKPMLSAASEYGVRTVRNPFECSGAVTLSQAMQSKTLFIRKAETTLLRAALRGRWAAIVRKAGFATTDGSLGVVTTGTLNEDRLRSLLAQMPGGTWELVCHPGYNDAELNAIRTKLRASREIEKTALMAITERELLERHGVELISFQASPNSVMRA